MARLTATLLFAGVASANFTTTVWMSKIASSDKYGYVASVVAADAQHMTLAMDFDADTDKEALHIGGAAGNYTFGASSYTINQAMTNYRPEPTGDMNIQIQCTQPAQSGDDVSCTGIIGDGFARFGRCNEYQTTQTNRPQPTNSTTSFTHTYGTGLWGSGGVETVTWTFNVPLQRETTTPAWCTSDDVPASVLSAPYTTDAAQFAIYQVVVTAGQEKLSAYSGSSAAVSTATGSTSSVPGATASTGGSGTPTATAPPESTGAAGKISIAVPALAAMGFAVVVLLL